VPGWAVGWIDNGRLLVDSYLSSGPYTGVSMYSSSGLSLGLTIGATALPEVLLGEIQPVAGDSIYVPSFNLIFSLTTGSRTWMSGNPARGIGAVAGSRVVFLSGPRVLTESY